MTVGILALQGDVAEHKAVLASMNVEVKEVRTIEDLTACDRLIIPGGESTTINKLLDSTGLDVEIRTRVQQGMPVFGTCAGAIILCQLGLIDYEIQRNAYGSQLQSFEADLDIKGIDHSVHASFIRAPVITEVGDEVSVLASYKDDPVLVQQDHVLAGTFHTEVHDDVAVHQLFLEIKSNIAL